METGVGRIADPVPDQLKGLTRSTDSPPRACIPACMHVARTLAELR